MNDNTQLDVKKRLIKEQACFAKLTEEEIDVLATLLSEQRFAAGDTIVTEGDPVDHVYLILDGTADVKHVDFRVQPPKMDSIATLTAGNAIGLSDVGFYSLTGKRTATVIAITEVITFRLSVPQFHGFLLANSHVSEVMRQQLEKITNQ